MRRIILLALAGVLGFFGLVQVAPSAEEGPDFGTVEVTIPDGAVASPSVWYLSLIHI